MEDYILISTLNDFIFCPYSIYLHNIYMGGDEDLVHATPQKQGRAAHETLDEKKYSSHKDDITAMGIFSNELGLMGKIDLYKRSEKTLIERKYQLKNIYQGQIYQLWAQYFCMIEMGYDVEKIAFYETSTNKTHPLETPTEDNKAELRGFIERFRNFDPSKAIHVNQNKCAHCIYCNLCDKTTTENVYS